MLKRLYVSGAVECDIDDSGRILIPPSLREHANLQKEVLWAGAGKYAELWDKAAWKQQLEITDEQRQDMSVRLAELAL
jgi:MraZ protein